MHSDHLSFTGEYSQIPPHMQAAILRYVKDRLEPGDFLTAVITNNLTKAVFSADAVNLPLLKLYVQWFYWEAPGNCWGNGQAMREWLNPDPSAVAAESAKEAT